MPCLVIEGGAMRAAYGSGVARGLAESGFVPDALYGSSAGAAIGAWYAAGQSEVGCRTWDAVVDRRLMSFRRALRGRGAVFDFALLYGHYYPNVFGMDVDALRASTAPVFATVTDVDTGSAAYIDLRTAEDPFRVLEATSAIPFFVPGPVVIGGARYFDGGLADPVPIARAIEDGYDDIVLIANRRLGDRRPENPFLVGYFARRYPALAHHARNHHRYHVEADALADAPPEGITIRVIRPTQELGVTRLGRDLPAIHAAIEVGRRDGARAMGVPAAP